MAARATTTATTMLERAIMATALGNLTVLMVTKQKNKAEYCIKRNKEVIGPKRHHHTKRPATASGILC